MCFISVYACAFSVIYIHLTIIRSSNCFGNVRTAEQALNTILTCDHHIQLGEQC